MSKPLTTAERAALSPLLDLARQYTGGSRRVWLDELRREAPTVALRLEALLDAEHPDTDGVFPLPTAHRSDRVSPAGASDAPAVGASRSAAVGLPQTTRPALVRPPSVA